MSIKQKNGISLIVLVITIIVMIILASAIILSLNSSGIIKKANKAKEDTNISTIRNVASIAIAEYELEKAEGTITKTKKEYVEEYLNNQNIKLPEGYVITNEGQVLDSSEIIVISEWNGTVATAFASGTGTEADPYIIETAQQFAYLADLCNNSNNATAGLYYQLNADIDLKNISFSGMGYGSVGDATTFQGNLEGNNHKIYNLNVSSTNEYTAFIMAKNATIKNLVIESGTITGVSSSISFIVCDGTTIQNCINKADIVASEFTAVVACGIAYGEGSTNQITNCINYGTITAMRPYQISNVTYTNCQELGSTVTIQ